MGERWFAQEYCCEFTQDDASIFKEGWIQYYDPADLPYMDTIIQSWDTAQTKSSSSSYVVGQVWGRIGADFYLLDQVRGHYDFDETVRAIEALSKCWPQSTAILVEAQALGAALVTHLKHKIPGLIPITVKGLKGDFGPSTACRSGSQRTCTYRNRMTATTRGSANTCRSF